MYRNIILYIEILKLELGVSVYDRILRVWIFKLYFYVLFKNDNNIYGK